MTKPSTSRAALMRSRARNCKDMLRKLGRTKIPYATSGEAVDAYKRMVREGIAAQLDAPAGVYFCPHCRAWHWGRKWGVKWRATNQMRGEQV